MGIARLVLVVLAVSALVALIVLGVLSLSGALTPGSGPATPAPGPAATASTFPASPERVPTVLVQCLRERCPTVFVRITGGDVLFNREMVKDERARFFDAKIDVVLADSAAVRVRVNGAVRPPGRPGERQEFTASRG